MPFLSPPVRKRNILSTPTGAVGSYGKNNRTGFCCVQSLTLVGNVAVRLQLSPSVSYIYCVRQFVTSIVSVS